MTATALPEPDAAARAHSDRLAALIRAEIAAAGGAIPFSRFMELALYAPGLGYYSAGATKFGESGDFVTAPELGPTFAECVAEAMAPVLRTLGPQAEFLELGGGSGAFAEAALRRLAELDALPARYAILEPSADLRARQRERLTGSLPAALSARLHWLDGPPQAHWRGVLFANEVLDALPTPRFSIHGGEVYEEHVALDEHGGFIRVDRPADALVAGAVRHVEAYLEAPFAEGYRSEILPQLPYWLQAVGGMIEAGAMLFVDYGYPRAEYYLPERRDGTLVCHYRHRAHTDPYRLPGLQDLTAFVDFTALAEAGLGAGFDFAGYCSQANFLIGNGLQGRIAAIETLPDEIERHRRRQEIKRLTLPGEMGERFQVMGFVRGVTLGAAFALGDLSRRL
ncbi:class I SAM-dependent methyltransferase [Rehaibacterium terrae]|uniref:SAM-dependent MidA family methyltransferase n=1 Tax=Rehaibacterium terrae TaxID=1341696 RepID=A0A7W7V941_9GAMM|nr:SAM-dependent methyltransferase [Rehaibacterium terrae]MBB5014704.1 SAM-dependent MidA family methyltransferase [Rehaibacterium terrae]